MATLSTQELRALYNKSHVTDVATYTGLVKDYLSEATRRHNTSLDNTLVVGLCPDYRVSSMRLFSAEDTTSPLVELDYGLLKNNKYTVPKDILPDMEESIADHIMSLPEYGFVVEPFFAYYRNIGLVSEGVTSESFRPVRCFRIKWSNRSLEVT